MTMEHDLRHAALLQQAGEALHRLIESCTDSDDARYGTLSTSFVRELVVAALSAIEAVQEKGEKGDTQP